MIDAVTRGRLEAGRRALVRELQGLIQGLQKFDLGALEVEGNLYSRLKLGDHAVTFVIEGRHEEAEPGPRFVIVDGEAVERVGVEIAKSAKFRPEHRHAIPEFDPLASAWPWTSTTDEHMHDLPLRVPMLGQDETGVQLDHWHPIKRREETEWAQPFVRWYRR